MGRLNRTAEQVVKDIAEQHKNCSVCGERKHFDEFFNYKNKTDGKAYRCKICDGEAREKWAINNPHRSYLTMRKRNLKSRFGLSLEEYDEMLNKQKGGCALCGVTENKTTGTQKTHNFCVDHSHDTGKVRGLLCTSCNRGLGFLKDSSEILKKAAEYVRRHEETH